MDSITYRHSFNAGDCITILPGIKHLWQQTGRKALIYQRLNLPAQYYVGAEHPIKNEQGTQVCMNKAMFDMLKPLIEAQEYVEQFVIWEGQKVDFDYDLTRQSSQMPLPGGDIHKWPSLIYPQLECDLTEPWITAPEPYFDSTISGMRDCIIVNRTERYQNPYIDYYFLKNHKAIIFLGTKEEWRVFDKTWDINTIYLSGVDFLNVAQALKRAKVFIGNQSVCWHIADAMKVPRILEVCSQFPNTFPTGPNGYSFINQGSLEYHFNQLINEPKESQSPTP